MTSVQPAPVLAFSVLEPGILVLNLSGTWRANAPLPRPESVVKELEKTPHIRKLRFDAASISGWDSGLVAFVMNVFGIGSKGNVHVEPDGLPQGVQKLLHLATAVPERKGARRGTTTVPVLAEIGNTAIKMKSDAADMLGFIGDATLSLIRMARGKACYRRSDLILLIQECGVQALPIVSLISALVGLILAFVGAVQLRQFGAQIFVADLVGIAMAREMGAMMTAIIMAGRTAAAFAAQIGTMEVNEEVDALKTFGLSPVDFLVGPRMLALIIMMPLLCLYADLLGIIGGGVVGVLMLDITVVQYANQTRDALSISDFAVGIFKSCVFGVLIALAGCLRGMQCGRSASAVGIAATSAVVTAIVLIVVTDGMFAVITDILGI